MCCLFGLIDTSHQMSSHEKNRIVSILATASEARGTDATGVAFNTKGKLIIEKHPIPAHKMRFRIPRDARVVMGHTRMTTQGSARFSYNNHPFPGMAGNMNFALAHNGILTNDDMLRIMQDLPKSRIETDSYVAVQLIEKVNSLDTDAIRFMAESVKGTYCFSLLDQKNRLYLIKGNNPLCLYHFHEEGFYLYASTQLILDEAVEKMGFGKLAHEQIAIADGEILVIDFKGAITRSHFTPPVPQRHSYLYSYVEQEEHICTEYRSYMMDFAASMGVPRAELEWLHTWGISDMELEECIFDVGYRRMYLSDTGYYEEMEDEGNGYDCFKNLPWM